MATFTAFSMQMMKMPHDGRLHARVFTGDVHGSLLRAHQVLIAAEDAVQATIPSCTVLRLQTSTTQQQHQQHQHNTTATSTTTCLLEVVRDRRTQQNGGLPPGTVQVHPWVLDALDLFDGDTATLLKPALPPPQEQSICRRGITKIVLSVVTRSPPRATYAALPVAATNGSIAHGEDGAAAAGAAQLPESVRSGLVDLNQAVRRQLLSMYTTAATTITTFTDLLGAASGQERVLLPIQLMGETFVFRVVRVEQEDDEEVGESLDDHLQQQLGNVQIQVLGCSSSSNNNNDSVASLSIAMHDLQLHGDGDEAAAAAFKRRLSQSRFAAYEPFLHDMLFHILLNFHHHPATASTSSLACNGILLHGSQGVGKSSALHVLEKELQLRGLSTWRVDAMSLLMQFDNSKAFASAYDFLVAQFQQFIPQFGASSSYTAGAAGVVLIDDIDVLFQSPNGQQQNETDPSGDGGDAGVMAMPLGSALLRFLDAMTGDSSNSSTSCKRLCIIGATTTTTAGGDDDDASKMPSLAKRSGRFDKQIEMIVPTEAMRKEIVACHIQDLPLGTAGGGQEGDASSIATRLAALTGGYVAKDLVRICRRAYLVAHKTRHSGCEGAVVTWDHLLAAQRHIKPSQLRALNVASPSSSASEVGNGGFAGYTALQQQLCDFITWKFHPSEAMKQLGVANASGLLLHGPSGCGKSLLVKTLAAQAKVNFVVVKSSELLSKYFGDSERAVRQLFARARAASPCLLFFDEFDAIAHKRSFGSDTSGGGDGNGVYARILSTFLNEMDGVGGSSSSSNSSDRVIAPDVLVVAATNRIEALDAALIRPGRIDKAVQLGYPQQEDRLAILEFYTRKMPLAEDVDLHALAMRSTRSDTDKDSGALLSGADLAAICKEAAFRALRQDGDAAVVRNCHFEAAWQQRTASFPVTK